ncbi:MAG: hypothetical protein Q8N47_06795, partial [Bryobacterales bacterium]|nr:hypothetical protein [Bryobacterales bacterium]
MLQRWSDFCRVMTLAGLIGAGSMLPALPPGMRFGNLQCRPPQGWRMAEQNGSLTFIAPDSSRGQEAAIVLAPGRPFAGDFRAEFDKWVRLISSRDMAPGYGEVQQHGGAGYDILTQAVVVGPDPAHRGIRLFVAANPGGRFELILAMASSESLFRKYQAEFTKFLESVEYDEAPAAPVIEATPPAVRPAAAA